MDDENPPVRRLVLKQRDVDPVDKVARPGDGTAISVRLILRENSLASERPAGSRPGDAGTAAAGPGLPPVFKPKDVTPTDLPSFDGDESAISVPGMLQANRAAMDDSGPELIAMPPRRTVRAKRLISRSSLASLFSGLSSSR